MTCRIAVSVDAELEVTLTHWSLAQENGYGYVLVGVRADNGKWRMTTRIVSFDMGNMAAVTETGRRYVLQGPEDQRIAAAVLKAHIVARGLTIQDVALAELDELMHGLDSSISLTLPTPN